MKRLMCFLTVILFLQTGIAAQEEGQERDPFLFTVNVRLFGGDLGIGYRGRKLLPDADTIFWIIIGGGYEWLGFYRLPDNHLYNGGGGYDPAYTRLNGRLDLGIAQGFVFNEKIDANLFEIFLFYKTRYDYVIDDPAVDELILAGTLPDRSSIFQNSLLFGLSYNDLDSGDPHLVSKGIYGEISIEWGPEFLLNAALGRADFLRLNGTVKGFLPVFDLDADAKQNSLSGYLGAFLSIDYSTGGSIPINIQQTIGGRNPRAGLGGAIRGFEDYRFDGLFKTVLNLDFRLNLPQFEIMGIITPGVLVFFDSGYFDFVYYNERGFLFSTGAGVYLNVWGFTSFTAFTAVLLNRPLIDGTYWVPLVFLFSAQF